MICKNKVFLFFVNLFLLFLVAICIIPFWLMFVSSITSETSLAQFGYSLWPREINLDSYRYLWTVRHPIARAYMMSFIISGIGVTANVTITTLFAYPLSRKDLPGRRIISFILFFTMLFNGGFVPTYIVYSHLLKVSNTLAGMIIPYLLMNAFHVIMMRTYMATNIPTEVIEAAKIDGASEFQCLGRVVLPMSRPIIATVALMSLIAYWNNWTNGVYFLTSRTDLYSIQNYLNAVLNSVQFLANNATGSIVLEIPSIGIRMAIAFVAVVPVLCMYPFFQKSFVKGITIGSVKG